ncbi:hypothetical protein L9F63_007185, partial [Diploptera punctata]
KEAKKVFSGKDVDVKALLKNPQIIIEEITKIYGKMSESGPPSRPMKYPYTFSAKIAQFPLKFYVTNQWIWKYYMVSLGLCLPIFYSISKLANSPGNKAKWAEMKRKEAEEHHH